MNRVTIKKNRYQAHIKMAIKLCYIRSILKPAADNVEATTCLSFLHKIHNSRDSASWIVSLTNVNYNDKHYLTKTLLWLIWTSCTVGFCYSPLNFLQYTVSHYRLHTKYRRTKPFGIVWNTRKTVNIGFRH